MVGIDVVYKEFFGRCESLIGTDYYRNKDMN